MTFKTVMAYMRSEAELKRVMATVELLVKTFPDLHCTGLYSIPSPIAYAEPNGFVDPGMFEMHDKQHKERSENLKQLFEAGISAMGVKHEFRIVRSETGTAADGVIASCLGAELLVAGQPDPDDPGTNDETAETIVFHASCPVLLVPYAPALDVQSFDRILVAFNGKREASRAALDALPFMEKAESTEIVWIDPPENDDENSNDVAQDLVATLGRHGVDAKLVLLTSHGKAAHSVMRDYLLAQRMDLLVLGAFSHSRLRELFFGGVTRAMLSSLAIPTLFSR
ncbi:universal stress protein [Daeguia caeni]|uniref:Universal stress protein n=1 Tax=Daeguia caeni TaxID=439612 RepID=A0ABV9H7J3_9HYPH